MAKKMFKDSFLNEYMEKDKIGEGGNSFIYSVLDLNNCFYALKLLKENLSTEKIKRFKNELYFGMNNNHPNIIKVIGNGIINIDGTDRMFYLMPLYSSTLRKMINEGIDPGKILEYFNQILEGIKFVHGKKIYHRDLKPENVLFDDKTDKFIVSDFGIAHFVEKELHTVVETKLHQKLANFQYAAPEQREVNGVVDQRSDIYSLGLILNEMFTKKIPLSIGYTKISDINNDYAFLDEVVDMMIQQDSNKRISSIEQVQYEIKARVELRNKQTELEKLRNIKILDSEEKDILILEPPKLIDYKFDEETNRLDLILSQPVNDIWVQKMTAGSYNSYMSYDPRNFTYIKNIFSINIRHSDLNILQGIVNYFKEWINNANRIYTEFIKQSRDQEKRRKEQELEMKLKKQQEVIRALEKIKL